MKIRTKIDDYLAEQRMLDSELQNVDDAIEFTELDLVNHDEARILIQKSAQITQKNLEEHIEKIVSKALKIVFLDEAKKFKVTFVTRRNTTECDLKLEDRGNLRDPLGSNGFGEADIISIALRIAYWSLGNTRNTLILDEPFRYLDGRRMERASEMVKILSEELGLQIIMVTHESKMGYSADKRFHVVRNNCISEITEVQKHSMVIE